MTFSFTIDKSFSAHYEKVNWVLITDKRDELQLGCLIYYITVKCKLLQTVAFL